MRNTPAALLAAATVMPIALWSPSTLGDTTGHPYAKLGPLDRVDLQALHGRQAVLFAEQRQEALSSGTIVSDGDVGAGGIDLGNSLQHMGGIANQVFTTGHLSSSQGQVIVNIYLP